MLIVECHCGYTFVFRDVDNQRFTEDTMRCKGFKDSNICTQVFEVSELRKALKDGKDYLLYNKSFQEKLI
jgi:hypothetical protein